MYGTALPASEIPFRPRVRTRKEPARSNEMGKILLRSAGTLLQRYEAVKTAHRLGMPLREIETYLDWLDSTRD